MTAWPPAALVESLRLASPSAAVDPDVHTPERVKAHLAGLGLEENRNHRSFSIWVHGARPELEVLVPLFVDFPEYTRHVGVLAATLANAYDAGELGILAAIANQTTKESDHA